MKGHWARKCESFQLVNVLPTHLKVLGYELTQWGFSIAQVQYTADFKSWRDFKSIRKWITSELPGKIDYSTEIVLTQKF